MQIKVNNYIMKLFLLILTLFAPIFAIADSELETYNKAIEGKTGAELNAIVKKLSEEGNKYACYDIAVQTISTEGTEELGEKMLKYLFNKGMIEAGYILYSNYNDEKSRLYNRKAATRLILQIAQSGDGEAIRISGIRYLYGMGTEKNLKKAKEFLEKAIEKNNYNSASELSEIYIQEKNYAKALPLLKKKMNEGDLYAIELLAILYENGMGVERDYITAYALTLLHIYQYRKIYKTDNGIENLFHRKRRLLNALDYDSEREAITLAARLSVKIFKTTGKDRFKELSN